MKSLRSNQPTWNKWSKELHKFLLQLFLLAHTILHHLLYYLKSLNSFLWVNSKIINDLLQTLPFSFFWGISKYVVTKYSYFVENSIIGAFRSSNIQLNDSRQGRPTGNEWWPSRFDLVGLLLRLGFETSKRGIIEDHLMTCKSLERG